MNLAILLLLLFAIAFVVVSKIVTVYRDWDLERFKIGLSKDRLEQYQKYLGTLTDSVPSEKTRVQEKVRESKSILFFSRLWAGIKLCFNLFLIVALLSTGVILTMDYIQGFRFI
jgi:hypothetical protein